MKKNKKDIRLLKKCLKKSEQCSEYFELVVKKMVFNYGTVFDKWACLPVYLGNEAYRIYRVSSEGIITYLTKSDEVREVNSLGRLIQAIQLMLDSLESGKY